jgi:hypothetical protein
VRDGNVTVTVESSDVPPITLGRVERKTDDEGRARFELRLPELLVGRPQDLRDGRVSMTATIRDPAGQTQSRTESRVVTANPIHIEVVPESGALVQGQSNRIHFLTSTPDGKPAPARLSVTGVERELKTDSLGLATLDITPHGTLLWKIRAADDQGREGHREVTLRPGGQTDDYLVRVEKAVLRGGEPLRVEVLGGGIEPVFLDLIKDGQTALSASIPITRGRGELSLDLPAELNGTLLLCTYRYGEEGLPVRKTRVLQVQSASDLIVRTTLDREEYRPGERARLTINLTDERGNPAPGAVSLAAVDEAVFALLDRRPGLERDFFSLERDLLRPVYEIHDWSPFELDAAPPADRAHFEQALFARTADRTGGTLEELKAALGPNADELDFALRVLDRPDWEVLAGSMRMPEGVVDLLKKRSGPHTLSVRSYPVKAQALESSIQAARGWFGLGWTILAVVAIVAGFTWLYLNAMTVLEIVVILMVAAVVIGLMLPAVQSAREASRRASAVNDLKQLELAAATAPGAKAGGGGEADAVRVRQWFPETLLWRPDLITDDQGRASLEIDLADSITTWRLTAGAVSADGKLGGTQGSIHVFQPFFVDLNPPLALTRGDEIALPVVVSNYLDRAQTVILRLDEAPGFERLEDVEKRVELGANEVKAIHYRIRARDIGSHPLQVTARAQGVADAVKRTIDVIPDGRRIERVVSGLLEQPAEVVLETPTEAIEGSVRAIVKLYPSNFSQLVEGLEAIFQMPNGCFEQTSSTTYPNVLALDYLRRAGKNVPGVEVKARQYIHLGYQRLLSFEIPGGGFDWFGRPPANRTLTAYGLMEFQDMAGVHDVDPSLIERTRKWLIEQQRPDGSWDPEGHRLHEDPTRTGSDETMARLTTTAYIAWAVFAGRGEGSDAQSALGYLQSVPPRRIDDPYSMALVANALLALQPSGLIARPYLERLESIRETSSDGKHVWWDSPSDRRTLFHGGGQGRRVETTALATLALMSSNSNPETIRNALAWLVASKDGRGTWHSTQATVLALKALVAGTGRPLGGDRPRRLALSLDGQAMEEVAIAADQSDVLRQIDLSDRLARGTHQLTLEDRDGSGSGYQVLLRYHIPDKAPRTEDGPLSIRLDYDRTKLVVEDEMNATASVNNASSAAIPMVVLDLPIPAGFEPVPEDLEGLVASKTVSKYQRTPRQVVVYLRDLEPKKPLNLRYRLRATMPVRVAVPAARTYSYYDPQVQATSRPFQLVVEGK